MVGMTVDAGERDFRGRFEDGLRERIDSVYEDAHGRFPDHRGTYSWVTGYLGDVFAPVWFVAENPSLTQVEKVSQPESIAEHQWSISRGDRLFRDLLFKHGFKGGSSAYSQGEWSCYITDVIKSTDRVKEHNEKLADARDASAEAWAPVLSWELECGRPKIIVSVGGRARDMLSRLISKGRVPDPKGWGARRMHIPHYVYVMSRPDNVRKLPAGHPVRQQEYDQQFGEIAAARNALPRVLRVSDGKEYELGTPSDLEQAKEAIFDMTGGSIGMGRWSYLYGEVLYGPYSAILEPEVAGRVSGEAADFLKTAGPEIPDAVGRVLNRLVEIPSRTPHE